MITFLNRPARHLALNRLGFQVKGENVDDVAYLLDFCARYNFLGFLEISCDFWYNTVILAFDTKVNAEAFLTAFDAEQGQKYLESQIAPNSP